MSERHGARGPLTVGDVGERRVIAELTRLAAELPALDDPSAGVLLEDIVVGNGDDAAVIDTSGPVVISTDTAVAGRHFRLDWSSPRQAGARAVVQSVADIAAMGARPTGVTVSLAAPLDTPLDVVLDLNRGIVAQAHRQGARVLGGDLVAAGQIVLTVTSVGTLQSEQPVVLGGARPGDVLAVSGPLGAAAAGLALLLAREDGSNASAAQRYPDLLTAYHVPAPDLSQGPVAARAGAHAMTDISDGLIEELVTMSAAAGVRLDVDSASVPRRDDLAAAAAEVGADLTTWTLTGGEDHELLAAFAGSSSVPAGWTVIGSVGVGRGAFVDGHEPGDLRGWQSFGPAADAPTVSD